MESPASSKVNQGRWSKISLVDLAGSERVSGTNDLHKQGGVHIKKSVLALATLRYAQQARSIINRIKVNESEKDKIIRELRAEIGRLKLLQNERQRLEISETPAKQKSWMERLLEAENLRKREIQLLKRKGLASELIKNSNQAYLVNLSEDLSGTLFYILPLGSVTIGRTRLFLEESQPDITLDGQLIAHNHCTIENDGSRLYVIPEYEHFETYLNGELVTQKSEIFHADRLAVSITFASQIHFALVKD
uniref:FHA domain-containing protein n=1 Tax=Glossina austeni TaxID=7395 RepID=A0A1A9VJA7_GLOAU